jgi:hypothetical protein
VADGIGALVEADGRAALGQHGRTALEIRVPLLGEAVEDAVVFLLSHRVTEALAEQAVVVVHDDRRDRLDAPIDLRRAEAEGAAAAHADHADAVPAHERRVPR